HSLGGGNFLGDCLGGSLLDSPNCHVKSSPSFIVSSGHLPHDRADLLELIEKLLHLVRLGPAAHGDAPATAFTRGSAKFACVRRSSLGTKGRSNLLSTATRFRQIGQTL